VSKTHAESRCVFAGGKPIQKALDIGNPAEASDPLGESLLQPASHLAPSGGLRVATQKGLQRGCGGLLSQRAVLQRCEATSKGGGVVAFRVTLQEGGELGAGAAACEPRGAQAQQPTPGSRGQGVFRVEAKKAPEGRRVLALPGTLEPQPGQPIASAVGEQPSRMKPQEPTPGEDGVHLLRPLETKPLQAPPFAAPPGLSSYARGSDEPILGAHRPLWQGSSSGATTTQAYRQQDGGCEGKSQTGKSQTGKSQTAQTR